MLIPRCEDGIQSGSETGVDCGGIHCVTCGKKFRFILLIYFQWENRRVTTRLKRDWYRYFTEYKELVENIPDPLCIDDITHTDAKGKTCADDFYENSPEECGKYDDKNFQAIDMCCACGGGRTYELKEVVQMKGFMDAVIEMKKWAMERTQNENLEEF